MKLKPIIIISGFVLLCIVIACTKNDFKGIKGDQFTISSVKEWYYGTFKKGSEWQSSNLKGQM